jgi:O-methyltransferase
MIKRWLVRSVRRILGKRGWLLVNDGRRAGDYGPLPFWDYDFRFQELYDEIRENTMVDVVRCYMLYQLCLKVKWIEGDAAEIGVWRGGTGRMLGTMLPGKRVYLFDTFEGLPAKLSEFDRSFHQENQFNDSDYESVKRYLRDLDNVSVIKGVFPDSSRSAALPEKFCLVHVDVDLYHSAIDCCNFFYPLLSAGGCMIFDDYGFGTCPGVTKAVDEFFGPRGVRPFYLPTGQCMIMKEGKGSLN